MVLAGALYVKIIPLSSSPTVRNPAELTANLSIVIITSIVVAATASAVSQKFGDFSRVGGIIGSSVSSAFLLVLGLANAYILLLLIGQMRKLLAANPDEYKDFKVEGAGCLFRVFKKLFKLIDKCSLSSIYLRLSR